MMRISLNCSSCLEKRLPASQPGSVALSAARSLVQSHRRGQGSNPPLHNENQDLGAAKFASPSFVTAHATATVAP